MKMLRFFVVLAVALFMLTSFTACSKVPAGNVGVKPYRRLF